MAALNALPTEIVELFDRLLAEWPEGIIAGGAVRDALLGYPINDIDLWAQSPIPGPWRDVNFGPQGSAPEYEMRSGDVQVTGAGQWRVESPYPVQVMPIKLSGWDTGLVSPQLLVRRFDYGICMVAYTRKEGLIMTPEFLADAAAKRCTLLDGRFTNNARRERMARKFPDWRFVDESEA